MKNVIKQLIKEEIKRLNEITTKDAYDKFYKDIPQQQFDKIISADPFTKPNFLSPYAKWLLNIYKKKNLRLEDLEAATEYIQTYNRYKDNYKNVNWAKLNTLADLYNVIKDDIAYSQAKTGNVNLCEPIDGAEKVHDGEEWCIIIPETEYAACYYGRNTEWCTAWGPMSFDERHKGKTSRFESHHYKGPLYIIINKNNQKEKYQFHFETSQYMDVNDNQISLGEFLYNNEEVYDFFKEIKGDDIDFDLCITALERGDTDTFDDFYSYNFTDNQKRRLINAAFRGDEYSDGYYTLYHVLGPANYPGMEQDFKSEFLYGFEISIGNRYDDENYDAKMFLHHLGGINKDNYDDIFRQVDFKDYQQIERILEIVQDFDNGNEFLSRYIQEKDININHDLLDTLNYLKNKFHYSHRQRLFSSNLAQVKINKVKDFQKGLIDITFIPKNAEGVAPREKAVSGIVNYKNIIKYLTIPQIPYEKPKVNESIKNKLITCKKCGHQWYLKDGGDDPYTCHMCNPKTLNEKCWKGYTQKGMKTMFGKRYPNCVKRKK